jgi:hypothetical protein
MEPEVVEEFDLGDIMSEDVDTAVLSKEDQIRLVEEAIKVSWQEAGGGEGLTRGGAAWPLGRAA